MGTRKATDTPTTLDAASPHHTVPARVGAFLTLLPQVRETTSFLVVSCIRGNKLSDRASTFPSTCGPRALKFNRPVPRPMYSMRRPSAREGTTLSSRFCVGWRL